MKNGPSGTGNVEPLLRENGFVHMFPQTLMTGTQMILAILEWE
jgi:hypothetical protein